VRASLSAVLGTFFGAGLSPVMPGTCGSIAAAAALAFVPGHAYGIAVAAGIVLTFAFGPAIARRESRRTGFEDPQTFVLDEACGVWIAMWRPENPGLPTLFAALVVFRILDITKPGPIAALERVPNGRGVMYDDVAAGIAAWAVVVAVVAIAKLAGH
jgi:phosphatidylglycerophosphatase A